MNQQEQADDNDMSNQSDYIYLSDENEFDETPPSSGNILSKIIAWTLFGGGCVAVALSLTGYPIKNEALKLYVELFIEKPVYTSIIKDEPVEKKTNVQEILSNLGDDFSPNLLLKLSPNELAEAKITQKKVTETSLSTDQSDSIFAVPTSPPEAKIVQDTLDELTNTEDVSGETEEAIPNKQAPVVETSKIALVEKTEASPSPIAEETPPFVVEKQTKAPLRPLEEPAIVKEPEPIPVQVTPNEANKIEEIIEATTNKPEPQKTQLEDLLFGLNWQTKKTDVSQDIVRCLQVTASIEGCRLSYESWLPDTRYVIGLFDNENSGKLIALQVDSVAFQDNQALLQSFEAASDNITNKISSQDIVFKEDLLSDTSNMISMLATQQDIRHFRHWSLIQANIPAYINTNIKALNETVGFHRTLLIETKLNP